MSKNNIIIAVITILIIGGIVLSGKSPNTVDNSIVDTKGVPTTTTDEKVDSKGSVAPTTGTKTPSTTGATKTTTSSTASLTNPGRVVFTITDEAVGLDAIQSIMLTVDEVSAHSQKTGWVTVSKAPKTFDLLDLFKKSQAELLQDTSLSAGTYNQIRFAIGKVVIVEKGSMKSVEAKVPSQKLIMNTKLVVDKSKISGVAFDVDSAKSLHKTGNGTYIFFPVIKLHTQHDIGSVQIISKHVDLFNGLTDFDQTFGVDENGSLKSGFTMSPSAKIELIGKAIRVIPNDEKSDDLKIGAQSAIDIAVKGGYITDTLSVQTVVKEQGRVWKVVGMKGTKTVNVYVDIGTGTVVGTE